MWSEIYTSYLCGCSEVDIIIIHSHQTMRTSMNVNQSFLFSHIKQ